MIFTVSKEHILLRPKRRGRLHATGIMTEDGVTYCGRRSGGWRVATERTTVGGSGWCMRCFTRVAQLNGTERSRTG